MVNLPYNLRENQVAYAGKVMANFRALLGAYGNVTVNGIGENGSITADVPTMLQLFCQAMIKANEEGNADQIKFEDGETLTQKYAAGTLNASVLDSEGLFYFNINPEDGHLYVTAADAVEEENFNIGDDGHLTYSVNDPETNNSVHVYDLGRVRGGDDKVLGYYNTLSALEAAVTSPNPGDRYGVGTAAPYLIYVYDAVNSTWVNSGSGDMPSAIYDPNNVRKDLNRYIGRFTCYAVNDGEHPAWGSYFLTEDTTFQSGKTYYIYDDEEHEYEEATVTTGATVTADTYYEKLDESEYRLDDNSRTSGTALSSCITATNGLAFIGPDQTDEEGAAAWADAKIWAKKQGNGWILLKALGDIPSVSIDLLVTMTV